MIYWVEHHGNNHDYETSPTLKELIGYAGDRETEMIRFEWKICHMSPGGRSMINNAL